MKIRILCTLGPSSLREDVIRGLDERAVDLYRINLSHTPLEAVAETIQLVRKYSQTPISLDSEGPQVRCGMTAPDVVLMPGTRVRFTAATVTGTDRELTLWPASVFAALAPGAIVGIDFDGAQVRVDDVEQDTAVGEVISPGRVRSNKAVTIDPRPELPALSPKDLASLGIGADLGILDYALSFAASAADVHRLRDLAPQGSRVIAKIESREGVRNMDGIIGEADAVLIDRGDLSREVPLEHVPFYQKAIVRRANRWNRPAYVATNLLESMVNARVPTIAEANDIANTLLDGVHGLVLAAETAIGTDPVGAVDMVLRAVRAFERASDSQLLEEDRAPLVVAG